MTDRQYVESVERVIAAPPEQIFDLVADPSRHAEIDGGGTVRDATEGSRRLALGDTFGMSMKAGIGYSMANTVVEFDDNRCIAWRPETTGRMGTFLGGRIWRYELEPVEGGTRVRETWDVTEQRARALVWRSRERVRKNMDATLERIDAIVTA